MKKFQIIVVLLTICFGSQVSATLITSSGDSSLTGSTLIDFNSEALGSFSSRTFNGDVTFNANNIMTVETTYSGEYGSSGAYIGTPGGSGNGDFDIVFATVVSAFGFSWGAADQAWTMDLFDASDVLIDSINITAQSYPYIGFIGANDSEISRVSMSSFYGNDYILLDDFQYVTSTTVPEPTTLALIGLGLIGVRFSKRKKNA